MFYSEDIIEEVRERNDIVDVISGYVSLKKQGSNYFGLCPFHNEKSPSFSVSPSKQMYHCFGCGEGGNVFGFVMKYENLSFPEALAMLAERAGVSLPEHEQTEQEKREADIREKIKSINIDAAKYFYGVLKNENEPEGLAYFKGRGLSDETIKKFGLGYTGKKGSLYGFLKHKGYNDFEIKESGLFNVDEKGVYDKFWNRVMFPILDANKRLVAFGGRVLGDAKPKYLNSPETKLFNKRRTMYGMYLARTSRKDYAIICEGYMDVISLHQAGFNNAVAALGTSFTIEHANLIKRYFKRVVLSFDSDEAGIKAAIRAIPILVSAGVGVRVLTMAPYKDPDEFIKNLSVEEYQKRIDEACNYFIFMSREMSKKYDLNTPDGKTDFYNNLAVSLTSFNEELERNNYIEACSREFNINKSQLTNLVQRMLLSSAGKKTVDVFENKPPIKVETDDYLQQSQRILLTWLVEEPQIYDKISRYISAEDFSEGFYRNVALILWDMLKNNKVNPAKILDGFTDEEEHKKVSLMFSTPLSEALNKTEREKALNEVVINIRLNSIKNSQKVLENIDDIQKQMAAEEDAKRIHIIL